MDWGLYRLENLLDQISFLVFIIPQYVILPALGDFFGLIVGKN
ncbi:hypothetical protein L8106_21959 [Lyngbya sp. PCC 8106]|nr:hypothetical protein L8106_21959 [Lyngbya sp. PCC 8106]